MLPARSFCSALAFGLVLLIKPLAHADYACDADSLDIATAAHNSFSAEVVAAWEVAPDGSKKQTWPGLLTRVAGDDADRVVVRRPAHWPSQEARKKNEPEFLVYDNLRSERHENRH